MLWSGDFGTFMSSCIHECNVYNIVGLACLVSCDLNCLSLLSFSVRTVLT